MKTLIYENLAPITFRIGFLSCSLERAGDFFISWNKQHLKHVESEKLEAPLDEALRRLDPLTSIPRQRLFVQTAGNWIAYFDNCIRGPDPVSAIGYMTQQLGCRGVIATVIPHSPLQKGRVERGVCGAVQFELFASHKTDFLNYERTVSVAYDTKWRFDANGRVQSFEDEAMYKKRRIIDRFTPEMLKSYCNALGINVEDPGFYQGRALLVVTNDPLPTGHFALSLAQVRRQLGLGVDGST